MTLHDSACHGKRRMYCTEVCGGWGWSRCCSRAAMFSLLNRSPPSSLSMIVPTPPLALALSEARSQTSSVVGFTPDTGA